MTTRRQNPQSLPRNPWWEKWISPTSVLALLGGIVWGVQLNVAVLAHTAEINNIVGRMHNAETVNNEQNQTLSRVAVILQLIEQRVKKIEDRQWAGATGSKPKAQTD